MTASKPKPASIHAKCCKVKIVEDRTLVCAKSKDHASKEHFDPSFDERWTDR